MSLSRILKGTHSRDMGVVRWVSQWLFRLWEHNYQCSSPDLWNFQLEHAGSEKSQNQDLRASPALSINSGKMESRPGDFPGLRSLRAAASPSGLKGSEILHHLGVGTFHLSNSCLLTSLVNSRLPVYVPVLHELRGDGVCRDGAQARGVSRPAS